MHGGLAGADFKPEECFPNIIRHSLNYINEQKDSKKPFFLYLPITAPHTPILPSKEFQGKTSIGPYGDFVVMIDDMVRQIVKTLKKNKQLDNTIIVFASDNGCAGYIGVKDMEKKGHFLVTSTEATKAIFTKADTEFPYCLLERKIWERDKQLSSLIDRLLCHFCPNA